MSKPVIGFIGVGLMGHGMAKNIVEKGYPLLVVAHRNRAPIDDLVGRGAVEVASPREMAEKAAIVHLCVSGSPQVEAAVLGPNGVLEGAKPGLAVIDCSTSDPTSTKRIAARLAEKGVRFADAPLARTPREAEAGTLDTMVGADAETFALIKPVIDCWAGNVVHLGDVGAGHTMKLVNNFISIGYGALYSEALALSMRAGLTPDAFHAVIGKGRMACGFYETFMRYVIERDPDAHRFTLRNAHKDMRYVAALASETGSATFLQGAIRAYLASAEAMGRGDDNLPMLSDHLAALNGVDLSQGRTWPRQAEAAE